MSAYPCIHISCSPPHPYSSYPACPLATFDVDAYNNMTKYTSLSNSLLLPPRLQSLPPQLITHSLPPPKTHQKSKWLSRSELTGRFYASFPCLTCLPLAFGIVHEPGSLYCFCFTLLFCTFLSKSLPSKSISSRSTHRKRADSVESDVSSSETPSSTVTSMSSPSTTPSSTRTTW